MKDGKKIFFAFLFCAAVDMFNKNFYLAFTNAETVKKIYWVGQSFTFLCYIAWALYVSYCLDKSFNDKWILLLRIALINWIAFAIGDFIDEVGGAATKVYPTEYVAFIISIPYTIYLWKKRLLRN